MHVKVAKFLPTGDEPSKLILPLARFLIFLLIFPHSPYFACESMEIYSPQMPLPLSCAVG